MSSIHLQSVAPSAPHLTALQQLRVFIGTAGWTLPRAEQHRFALPGTHLQRYATRLPAVEINSSFYRPHRRLTYEKWARVVPEWFRFSVKMPKEITHESCLVDCHDALSRFLHEIGGLGDRLGCLLVQLAPSFEYNARVARTFLERLRADFQGNVALEARHPTWFTPRVNETLNKLRIARVAADPARATVDSQPGGWSELVYYRLHGSPRIYYSRYDDDYVARLSAVLSAEAQRGATVWCIFDNTALGYATANALDLLARIEARTLHINA